MQCPKCFNRMEIDDEDYNQNEYTDFKQAITELTRWYVCNDCKITCIVVHKYNYFKYDGEQIEVLTND